MILYQSITVDVSLYVSFSFYPQVCIMQYSYATLVISLCHATLINPHPQDRLFREDVPIIFHVHTAIFARYLSLPYEINNESQSKENKTTYRISCKYGTPSNYVWHHSFWDFKMHKILM